VANDNIYPNKIAGVSNQIQFDPPSQVAARFAPGLSPRTFSRSRALWFVGVFLVVYGLMRVFRRKRRM
jgi:hypothetical protein